MTISFTRGRAALVRALAGSLLFATTSLVAGVSRADECILGPISLPGLPGPPSWNGAEDADDWRAQLHDPRWAGGPLRSFGTGCASSATCPSVGADDDARFRVIRSGNFLYVSFQALADSTLTVQDKVYFGYTRGAAGRVVAVIPDSAGAWVATPATPHDTVLPKLNRTAYVSYYETTDASATDPSWTRTNAIPSWVSDVVTWTGSPGVTWAVTFKVDISGAGAAFKVVYGMLQRLPSSSVLRFGTPDSVPQADSVNGDSIVPKSSGDWASVTSSACSTGITLDRYKVGVDASGTLTNHIQACNGSTVSCPKTNTFQVQPENVPSAAQSTHGVRARIRIADWGSTVDDRKFAPWKPIAADVEDVFVQATLPSTWAWTSGGAAPITRYTCVAASDSYCPELQTTGAAAHQCMLVELGSPPGLGAELSFQNAAVYRNMEFQNLSTLDEAATITIEGLQQATGQAKDRDVYLYVQTVNMPGEQTEPIWLPSQSMAEARDFAEGPLTLPAQQPQQKPLPRKDGQAPKPDGPSTQTLEPTAEEGISPALSGHQVLLDTWPTYLVHVYYDTGETMTLDGQTQHVLRAMVPFGYFLNHDGPFYGFAHAISGLDGVSLTEIAPNFYRVRIKNEGKIRIRNTITALERPPHGPCGCQTCCNQKPPIVNVVWNPKGCYCRVGAAPVGDPRSSALALTLALSLLGLGLWRRRR